MSNTLSIFVITPTFCTPKEWLERCVDSVRAQSISGVQQIIINDGDADFKPPPRFRGMVINCADNAGDYGDTPRAIGIAKAIDMGASTIAFLDADNWYEPDHLESVIKLKKQSHAAVIATKRTFRKLDGEYLADCPDCGTIDFADTSAMVFFQDAFHLLRNWRDMSDWMHPIADRVIWNAVVNSGLKFAFTDKRSLNYRCRGAIFYQRYGAEIPQEAEHNREIEEALERWRRETSSDLAFERNYIGRGYTERFTPSC